MKSNRATVFAIMLLLTAIRGQLVNAQVPKPSDLESFVKYMQAHHEAPFDRDSAFIPPDLAKKFQSNVELKLQVRAPVVQGSNIRVNQDRNPWPKAEVASAVDPVNGNNYVVM